MNYLKTFLPYLFGNKKGKSLEFSLPATDNWHTLTFEEVLMFHALSNTLNSHVQSLDLLLLSNKDLYHLFNFLSYLDHGLQKTIVSTFHQDYSLYLEATRARAIDKTEMQELLNFKTDQLTVFAILKENRKEPGVLIIRLASGQFMRNKDGGVWSIPILGLSGRGLPFHHSNGQTPTGVFTIDSVMPEANKNFEFGKFRRLIVNFIPPSDQETNLLKYLPKNHHAKNWWKPSLLGRILGRSLLRIHGTGDTNLNPFSSYFPFVPTSGCLATNEARFFGFRPKADQRLLLDALMSALDLQPIPENESKIHGLLYVVDFGDNLTALTF